MLADRTWTSPAALNRLLADWQRTAADQRIQGTTKRQVGELTHGELSTCLQPRAGQDRHWGWFLAEVENACLFLLGRHPGWREGGADGVQLGNQRMEVLRTSTPSVVGLPKRPLVAFTPAILKLLVRPFFRLAWAWRGSISTPRTVGVRADEFAALLIPNPRPRHLPQNCAG